MKIAEATHNLAPQHFLYSKSSTSTIASQHHTNNMSDHNAGIAAPLVSTFRERLKAYGISKLHKVLTVIKQDIDAGSLLLSLALSNLQYCTSCSPLNKTGVCDRMCPLLGPVGTEKAGWKKKHAIGGWAECALASMRSYHAICDDIEACGEGCSIEKLHKWQKMVEQLHLQGLNRSEVQAEYDWGLGYHSMHAQIPATVKEANMFWKYPVCD